MDEYQDIKIVTNKGIPEGSFLLVGAWRPVGGGLMERESVAWRDGEIHRLTETRSSTAYR